MSVDARVGTELAGYRIEALLGRGGMGTVYLAEDVALGRKVALKLLSEQLADDERFRDRFFRESRLAASLDHPNIVPIYQAAEVGGLLFIAMRYVEGTDLRRALDAEGTLDLDRTVVIAAQVADALDAAHEQGLVHRDVKPANILIARRGEREHCYLADFGLTKQATSISGLTATGQLVGTVDYLSPEQVKGDPLDGRADQYALACVVYECLTGEPPFRRENEVATLWAHTQDARPAATRKRPDLSTEIDAALEKGMAKRPADRYPTSEAFVTAARAAIPREERPSDVFAPLRRRYGRAIRRTRAMLSRRFALQAGVVAGALALLLVAAIAGAVILLTRGDGERPVAAGRVVKPNTLARIDARTGRVTQTTQVGEGPNTIEVTNQAAWVVNAADGTVSRIDRRTRQVTTIAGLQGACDVAVGASGAPWVSGCESGVVTRLNPTTARIERVIRVGSFAGALAIVDGTLWVESGQERGRGGITRVDLASGRMRVFPLEGPRSVAASSLAVWVANSSNVVRISPISGDVATINAGANSVVVAVDPAGSGVWVGDDFDATLRHLEESGRVNAVLRLPAAPGEIAVDEQGAAWVTAPSAGLVLRIDPETHRVVRRINLGRVRPQGVDVLDGSVWVSVAAP